MDLPKKLPTINVLAYFGKYVGGVSGGKSIESYTKTVPKALKTKLSNRFKTRAKSIPGGAPRKFLEDRIGQCSCAFYLTLLKALKMLYGG